MTFSVEKPNGFTFQSVVLDGSSYFDVRVEHVSVSDDYSFSGWFKSVFEDGTLFHYKADSPTATLKEMKMWLVLKKVYFERVLQGVVERNFHGSTFSTNTWYYVSFGIAKSTGTMWVYADDIKVYDKDEGYQDNVAFSLPGTLRIGGTFDNSVPTLSGFATCIGFYSYAFPHLSTTNFLCSSTSQSSCKYISMKHYIKISFILFLYLL